MRRCSGRHVCEFLEARADWANNLGVQREEALAITILEEITESLIYNEAEEGTMQEGFLDLTYQGSMAEN